MGMGRAGWYSYDWLAQVFSSVSTRSTARIIPALQDIKTGDPIDFLDRMVFTVAQAIPGETLVLVADENQRPLQPWVKSWSFILNRLPSGATRLLIREISAWDSRLVGFLTSITGWAWFMATRRQLKNIKALAEAT
jgi:hypothetical protein